MTLQASGALGIKAIGSMAADRSIQYEIEGNNTGAYSLVDCWDNSDAEFRYGESLPKSITDWYGYAHTPYGQCGGISDSVKTGYIKRVTQGNTYQITTGDLSPPNFKFTANQNEDTRVDADAVGTAFASGDKTIGYIYRRERGATGSWTLLQTWNGPSGTGTWYLSNAISCDFTVYNYYWLIAQGS